MEQSVAATAVLRAVLIARLVFALVAVGAGIRLVADPVPPLLALGMIALVTVLAVIGLDRRPQLVRRQLWVITADIAVMIAVLLVDKGGVAFYCYAAGSAAVAGVLLGFGGAALWVVQTLLGLSVAVHLLRGVEHGPVRQLIAPLLVAAPMIDLVCGLGAAALTAALARYIRLSVRTAMAAQRSAAASERARLARELHDSVAKTLRGISFAALALPDSLRGQPAVAEQLATIVSEGADAAVRETRELLTGLRSDAPDQPFAETVRRVCDAWSTASGIDVRVTVVPAEPSVAARYELTQILQEALRNVAQHAAAQHVEVTLGRSWTGLALSIRDDGVGFDVPSDLSRLSTRGSFGVVGMAERARTVGATVHVESQRGSGTVVRVVAPAVFPAERTTAP
jgi:signal transduction histidine kinase